MLAWNYEPREPWGSKPPDNPRTCPALAPYSYFAHCGEPVIGRSNKRYCSRRCQNREQKGNWRANNWMASTAIRLRERHASALRRNAENLRQLDRERVEARAKLADPTFEPADAMERLLLEADAGYFRLRGARAET
jgi:hypothetical protein